MRELGGASLVITGESRGIGRAATMAFARQGACVTPAACRETVLREGIEGGWRSPAKRAMVTAGLAIAAGLVTLVLAPRAARGADAKVSLCGRRKRRGHDRCRLQPSR
jgi:NAD(P)-dependent dehydrogenase (short-subunit alcohol dehydrogenase family)